MVDGGIELLGVSTVVATGNSGGVCFGVCSIYCVSPLSGCRCLRCELGESGFDKCFLGIIAFGEDDDVGTRVSPEAEVLWCESVVARLAPADYQPHFHNVAVSRLLLPLLERLRDVAEFDLEGATDVVVRQPGAGEKGEDVSWRRVSLVRVDSDQKLQGDGTVALLLDPLKGLRREGEFWDADVGVSHVLLDSSDADVEVVGEGAG